MQKRKKRKKSMREAAGASEMKSISNQTMADGWGEAGGV